MKKNPEEIVNEINDLLNQLVSLAKNNKNEPHLLAKKKKKGAVGALEVMMEEGFFDSPKNLSSIIDKMKEMALYYPKTSVSMNLLNLVRRRILIRINDKNTGNWQYVIRK